ncbi:MAG: nucleotide exchange factor GrpE [Candidatus Staskawiczbacteria bacterium]|nr:nucleotide exchange factor GrpE [Candidatus Staskawiczbacteria bacterium]
MTEDNKIKNNQSLYQCKECGLHYKDKDIAEKCETWCKENKTCNIEITRHAEENKSSDKLNLEECQKNCGEYLNNWKRERADFLNYKKDEAERIGFLGQYVKEDIIFKILPILDNIALAEKQLPAAALGAEWTKGFLQIQKQIDDFLKKEGIEEIKSVGEKFNPETMEAVGEAESSDIGTTEGGDEGTIVEEIQRGYKMNDKVLRPAKVKISK